MTESQLYTFLTTHKLGVLGSLSTEGDPQSALMGIAVTSQLEIVFDTIRKLPQVSEPDSGSRECSFTIGGWGQGEQTVQYEGEAEELRPPDLERYQEIYLKVWPDCLAHMSWPGIVYFAVQPTWIRYSDYDQNPPLIQEFCFPHKNL